MNESTSLNITEPCFRMLERNLVQTTTGMKIPETFHENTLSKYDNNGSYSGSTDIADDHNEHDIDSAKTAGRWTKAEHELFLAGLKLYNKQWKLVAGVVKTRTVVQVRTHAQKYFQKIGKSDPNSVKKVHKKSLFGGDAMTALSENCVSTRRHSDESDDNACSLSGVTTSSTCSNHSVSTDEADNSDAEKDLNSSASEVIGSSSNDSTKMFMNHGSNSHLNVMRTQSMSAIDLPPNRQPAVMLNGGGVFTNYSNSAKKGPQKRSRDDRNDKIPTPVSHIMQPTIVNMNNFNAYCMSPSNETNSIPINRCYTDVEQRGHNMIGAQIPNKVNDVQNVPHMVDFFYHQQPPSEYDDPNDQNFLSLLGDIDWQSMNHSNSLSPGSTSPQQLLGLDPECRAASPLFAKSVIELTETNESDKSSSGKKITSSSSGNLEKVLDESEVKNSNEETSHNIERTPHRKPQHIDNKPDKVKLDTSKVGFTNVIHSSDGENTESKCNQTYFATPMLNVGNPSPYAFENANSQHSSLHAASADRVIYDSAGQYSIFKVGPSSNTNNMTNVNCYEAGQYAYQNQLRQQHHFKPDRSWIINNNSANGYTRAHAAATYNVNDCHNPHNNLKGHSNSYSNNNMMEMLHSFSTDELNHSMPSLTLSSTSGAMISPPPTEKLGDGIESKPVRRRGRPRKITATSASPASALFSTNSNTPKIIQTQPSFAGKPLYCSFPPISFNTERTEAMPPSDVLFSEINSSSGVNTLYCSRDPIKDGILYNEINHHNPHLLDHHDGGVNSDINADIIHHTVDSLNTKIDDDLFIESEMLEAFDA